VKHFKVRLVGGGSLDIDADVWAEKGSFVIFGDLVGVGTKQSVREHTMVASRTVDIITVDAGDAPAEKLTVM
jgi:hypothetical protein